jgi:NAD(P)H-hydrate epimerase
MEALINLANQSGLPIIAIDIPSGVNGNSGEVESVAIEAAMTVALGLPKIGLFLKDGWEFTGELRLVDFGLPKKAIAKAKAFFYLPNHLRLPKIVRNRHKYQAGYVIGFGGSKKFPGAAQLSGLAALRAGAGIVRLFTPEKIEEGALELIIDVWNQKEWEEALLKAKAVFVGPGLGRSKKVERFLKLKLPKIKLPCVIDADALLANIDYPKMAVLTPHRGEMLRLLNLKRAPHEEELFEKVARYCKSQEVVIVLKGAPTFVFSPHSKPFIIPRGDPGMATAGSGDVLTGMIGALLAQGGSSLEAAILGAVLHGIAGELAAKEKTSYSLIASDLVEFMPAAFAALMKSGDIV